jgi:hypothetical protein
MFLWNVFIFVQLLILFTEILDDWIPMYPLNDLNSLHSSHNKIGILISTIINSLFVAIPLGLSVWYGVSAPLNIKKSIMYFYLGVSLGVIISWWVPYFVGSWPAHKKKFEIFKKTHQLLPPRGDNVVPNTLHILLHILIWTSLGLSFYFYQKGLL